METVKAVATIRKVQSLAEIILSKRVVPATKKVRNVPVIRTAKNVLVIRMVRNALVTRKVRNLAAVNTRIVQSPAVTTTLLHRNNLSFV